MMNNLNTFIKINQLLSFEKKIKFFSLNIKNILIISTPRDILLFERLLGNGKQLGINIQYKIKN